MTERTKKELVSQLYDTFADSVAAKDKDLKANHGYMDAAAQHQNLVIDLTAEVQAAGWQVSPKVIDALCHGGAELMTMELDEETIVPPADPVDEAGLRTDGPTLEEYVAAGYEPAGYPPKGYAAKPSAPVAAAEGADSQAAADTDKGTATEVASQDPAPAPDGASQASDQANPQN